MRIKTGLKDKDGNDIYEGEIIMVGMRRGDDRGWTTEQVIRVSPWWRFWRKEYGLQNFSRPYDGIMEMQRDPQLRAKIEPPHAD